MALLYTAALVAFHRLEGYPLTWTAFAERFRYPRLRLRDILWALVIFAACMVGYCILSQVSATLVARGILPVPQGLPVCPIITFSAQRMRTNWPAFIAHYIFNGLGLALILAAVVGML